MLRWDYKIREGPAPYSGDVEKHMGPGPHPGTGTEQTVHNEGRRIQDTVGRGGPFRYRVKDTWSEEEGATRMETAAISRDTVRRRINELKREMGDWLGNDRVKKMKVDYWLNYEKWYEEVVPGKGGRYPTARYNGTNPDKPWLIEGVILSPSVARNFFEDRYFTYHPYRVLAHELVHAADGGDGMVWPGAEQVLSEGMAEVVSMQYMAEHIDMSDWKHGPLPDGRMATGVESLVRSLTYDGYVSNLILDAGERVGWNREAVREQLYDWWNDPETYTRMPNSGLEGGWRNMEYLPHKAVDAEAVRAGRLTEARTRMEEAVARMEAQGDWPAEQIRSVRESYEKDIAAIESGEQSISANVAHKVTAQWESAVASAEAAGVDTQRIQRSYGNPEYYYSEDNTPQEVAERSATVGQSLMYWLLGGE